MDQKRILLFLLFPVLICRAQDPAAIQRMKSELEHLRVAPQMDTLATICDAYKLHGMNDSLEKYAYQLLDLSMEARDEEMEIIGHFYLGASYRKKDLEKAWTYFEKAYRLSEKVDYPYGKGLSCMALGAMSRKKGDMEGGKRYYREGIEQIQRLVQEDSSRQNLVQLGRIYHNFAALLEYNSEFQESLSYSMKCREIARRANDEDLLLRTLHNLHSLHIKLSSPYRNLTSGEGRKRSWEISKAYALEGLALSYKLKNSYYLSLFYANLGSTYDNMNMPDSALYYFKLGLPLLKKRRDFEGYATRLNSIGVIENVKKRPQEAKARFEEALAIAREKGYAGIEQYTMSNLANVYLNQGDLKKAHEYAQAGLEMAKKLNRKTSMAQAYYTAFRVYEKEKRYDQALFHYVLHSRLKDSIVNERNFARIQELQERFDTERKENQIANLTAKSRIQELRIAQQRLGILVAIVVALLLGAGVYFYNKQRILREKTQAQLARQRLLRAQINPHFFFNALSSVQTYFLEKADGPKAALYLAKFAKLMRLILENSRVDYVSLEEETETLELYLELQKVRFGGSFSYEIDVKGLDPEEVFVPPMFAQPFIENALEHGYLHERENGEILVTYRRAGEYLLEISILDNGVGLESGRQSQFGDSHISRATEIIRDRLKLLESREKDKFYLQVYDRAEEGMNGTCVRILLPYTYEPIFDI